MTDKENANLKALEKFAEELDMGLDFQTDNDGQIIIYTGLYEEEN